MKLNGKESKASQGTVLAGRGKEIVRVSSEEWEEGLSRAPAETQEYLEFMSEEHHRVRYFVVEELVRTGAPVAADVISRQLRIRSERVSEILDELERKLFFLVRNGQGLVSWAFPVTVEATPHRLRFDSGETLWAACAVDAIAAPFVQGRLRNKALTATVETECAHCGRRLEIFLDSELDIRLADPSSQPVLFHPQVDWATFQDPSIIHGF